MQTIHYAAHTAVLDPMTGSGLLTLPLPEEDVLDPLGGPSLHAASWQAVMADLAARGWDVLDNETGDGWVSEGFTAAGEEVIALYAEESITSTPSMSELAEAGAELRRAANL